jgi:short-subunit dehydrogenase
VTAEFRARYGPWAVIAGGSEGLGAAFAHVLAARGVNLVLLADGAAALEARKQELFDAYGVEVRSVLCDLADEAFVAKLALAISDIEVGLGVYNAAYSFVAKLFDRPIQDALRVIDVNCAGPLRFAHAIVPPMLARGRGGLVLVSSLAGMQGTPRLSAYAASKAFNIVLAEGLWAELGARGVDVVVSCPGAIRTARYLETTKSEAPGTLDPEVVAEGTLDALGHGPRFVPGALNKLATFVLGRIAPRTFAIAAMARSTARLT